MTRPSAFAYNSVSVLSWLISEVTTRIVKSKVRVANQALISKLLGVPGYEPASMHVQMLRRWRNEASLYCAANVALQVEIAALEKDTRNERV